MIKKLLIFLKEFFTPAKIVFAEYKDGIMTIRYNTGDEFKYEGDCTVWFELPLMKRQDTFMEYELHQLWNYCRAWKGPYPTAHLKK